MLSIITFECAFNELDVDNTNKILYANQVPSGEVRWRIPTTRASDYRTKPRVQVSCKCLDRRNRGLIHSISALEY